MCLHIFGGILEGALQQNTLKRKATVKEFKFGTEAD